MSQIDVNAVVLELSRMEGKSIEDQVRAVERNTTLNEEERKAICSTLRQQERHTGPDYGGMLHRALCC